MTAHEVALAVWSVIALSLAVVSAISHLTRIGVLKLAQVMRIALSNRYLRASLIVGWMWLGWHLFAR